MDELLTDYIYFNKQTPFQRNLIIEQVCNQLSIASERIYDPEHHKNDLLVETVVNTGEKKYYWLSYHGTREKAIASTDHERGYLEFLTSENSNLKKIQSWVTYNPDKIEEREVYAEVERYSERKTIPYKIDVPEEYVKILSDFGLNPKEVLEQYMKDFLEHRGSQGSDERMLAQGWFRRGGMAYSRVGYDTAEAAMNFYVIDHARF